MTEAASKITLLCARWVIPVVPDGVVLEHHAVAISDCAITDVLPQSAAATLSCRLFPGDTMAAVHDELRRLLDPSVTILDGPPVEVGDPSPLREDVMAALSLLNAHGMITCTFVGSLVIFRLKETQALGQNGAAAPEKATGRKKAVA